MAGYAGTYYPEGYYQEGHPLAGQPIPGHAAHRHSQRVPQGHQQPGYSPQQHPSPYAAQPHSSQYPPAPYHPQQQQLSPYLPQSYGTGPLQPTYASTSHSQQYDYGYPASPHPPDPHSQALIKHPGGEGHGKAGSGNRAGTKPSHKNKHPTGASHHKHSSRHHSHSGTTERQRRSTHTADTGGSHTRNDSGSIKLTLPGDGGFKLKGAGDSKVTFKNGPEGYNLGLEGSDASEREHGRKKAIEPPRRTRDRK